MYVQFLLIPAFKVMGHYKNISSLHVLLIGQEAEDGNLHQF